VTDRIPFPDTPIDAIRLFIYHQAGTQHDIFVRLDLECADGPGYQLGCLHCPGMFKTLTHKQLVETFGFEPKSMVDTLREAMEELARRLPGGPMTAWARILKKLREEED